MVSGKYLFRAQYSRLTDYHGKSVTSKYLHIDKFLPKEIDYKSLHEKVTFARKGFRLEKYTRESNNYGSSADTVFIKPRSKPI